MWTPQIGPQLRAINAAFVEELFFGGARGGGKSDYLLGDFAQDVENYGAAWNGVLFRKTFPQLEDLVARSKDIYYQDFRGSIYREQARTWHFPNGARLRMRFLENDADADQYIGHAYTWIGWDELPTWARPVPYDKLKATLRSAHEVRNKRIRATGNPGGIGHGWVKGRFVSPHPAGDHLLTDPKTGNKLLFIRSLVQDNLILMRNDPEYIKRLEGVGSAELVRAWLEGDWDVVLGAYFDNFTPLEHVVAPHPIPNHWLRFRSLDWGSATPFDLVWWAVSDGEDYGSYQYPKGAIIAYREWYGAKEGGTNVGLKLDAADFADGIYERQAPGEEALIRYSVSDPSIYRTDAGPSIGETMIDKGIVWKKADKRNRVNGWDQVRARLNNRMIVWFHTCTDSIRTIPTLQHDPADWEDVLKAGEDHAGDQTRYACMSRPWVVSRPPAGGPPLGAESLTINALMKEADLKYQQRVRI